MRDEAPTLAASDSVFEWCLRSAQRMERAGEIEQAALWAYVAAGTGIYYGHSRLCSPPLEALVARLGAKVAAPRQSDVASPPARRRWLHVLSASAAIGGHTALARRWIVLDHSDDVHSVVLTMQSVGDAATALVEVVTARGGQVTSISDARSLVARAGKLRTLAGEVADVVVLHTHQWDVVPSLAFAVAGGPPVLLLNHADHAFWIGVAVADSVIDIRDSGLALSQRYRSVRGSRMLPVPLEDHGTVAFDRKRAAERMGDPSLRDAALVLLTIGSGYKYRDVPGLDFPQALARIVDALPAARVVAVGPDANDPIWQTLATRTNGRVRAIGPDVELGPWHAAADLYLEGFPVGSYTAMMEVALAGRAIVRKPLLAPVTELPVDRGALAGIEPPTSTEAYVAAAVAYANDPAARVRAAAASRAAVVATHTGDAWNGHLRLLRASLPATHDPKAPGDVPILASGLRDYWARFHATARAETPLQFATRAAESQGLRVRTDIALLEALDALR